MIDRLHVAGDQGGLWGGLIDGGDILAPGDDGTQTRHPASPQLRDDNLGAVQACSTWAFQTVLGQIEGLFGGMGEDHLPSPSAARPAPP